MDIIITQEYFTFTVIKDSYIIKFAIVKLLRSKNWV